jgi:hypothetical protein
MQTYSSYPHKDPVLGLDGFVEGANKLLMAGGFVRRTWERYGLVNNGVNNTSWASVLSLPASPKISKAVLATKFSGFEFPERRKDAFNPCMVIVSSQRMGRSGRLVDLYFARALIDLSLATSRSLRNTVLPLGVRPDGKISHLPQRMK